MSSGVYGSQKGSVRQHRSEHDGSSGRGGDGTTTDSGHGSAWAIDFKEVELGELIATGSFGVVHSGTFRGKRVAIKFLLFPEASSEDELNRARRGFRQEVTVWHKLSHPNIVQFLGAYVNPPKWAIVTEFLEGGTVKGYLSRLGRKRLTIKQVVTMALDIARGMAYLHQNNIIHRDLKSANLLLNSSGVVKVADFGLARTESLEPGNMTAETGTVRWMAPEMIDHKPYTRKVDVYSFGIVLWELCTNQWPFEGFSFVQLAHAIVADNLRPPTKECPAQLVKLMTKCWDQNPDARPDFSDLVVMLEALLGGPSKKIKVDEVVPSFDGGRGEKGAGESGGGSSHDGLASQHGPRDEPVQDSGWKKISVEPVKEPKGGCSCSIL